MNYETNLFGNDDSFERTTPFPASNACYRSRAYTSEININPLAAACDQIINLVTLLSSSEPPGDRNKLLQDLAHEIRSFEHRAQIANYQANLITAARFALCCLVDEAIKSTSWGQNNNWAEDNLLSLFHNEKTGNNRFFIIVDRALENIPANIDLLELLYICLNLGFINEPPNEKNKLLATTNRLYQIIGQNNQNNLKNILIHEKKSETKQNETLSAEPKTKINTKKLLWVTAAFAFITSSAIYTGISLKLEQESKPTLSTIKNIIKNKSEF